MKNPNCLLIVLATSFVLGCGLSDAVDDLSNDIDDAFDDATQAEGPESCYSALESAYSALDSCSEDQIIGDEETAEALAKTWCDDNCSNLSEKVEYSDPIDCPQAINDAECAELSDFIAGTAYPSGCNWLVDDLGC